MHYFFFMAWFFAYLFASTSVLHAQLPPKDPFQENQQKKRLIQKQAACLTRCESIGKRRYYRCARSRRTYCNINAKLKVKACLRRCKAPWFCSGFIKTKAHCPVVCYRNALRKQPKRYFSKRKRRWITPSKKYISSWQKKTIYACQMTCQVFGAHCLFELLLSPKKAKRKSKKPAVPF